MNLYKHKLVNNKSPLVLPAPESVNHPYKWRPTWGTKLQRGTYVGRDSSWTNSSAEELNDLGLNHQIKGTLFQHVLSESRRIPGPTLSSPSICAPVSMPVSTTGTGGVLIYPNYHRSHRNLDSWVQLKWTAVCILIIQGAIKRQHKISTRLCPYIEIIQPGATILARIFPNLATHLWCFPQGSFLSVAIVPQEHECKELDGMCCMNLSDHSESIHQSVNHPYRDTSST
ncbi:uncharacterized protein WM294_015823 [Sarcoramphus papa]